MIDSLFTKLHDSFTFLSQFLAGPKIIGALVPSSLKLSNVMTSWVNLRDASFIVEFGPGTGSFTRVIREKMNPNATFIAIELNPRMVKTLKKKYPDLTVYNDSVANTPLYLSLHHRSTADCIISGLPWAAFDEKTQDGFLDIVDKSLESNGRFATFMYLHSFLLPSGQKFKNKLRERFPNVSISKVVWENFPPAIVYQAEKMAGRGKAS